MPPVFNLEQACWRHFRHRARASGDGDRADLHDTWEAEKIPTVITVVVMLYHTWEPIYLSMCSHSDLHIYLHWDRPYSSLFGELQKDDPKTASCWEKATRWPPHPSCQVASRLHSSEVVAGDSLTWRALVPLKGSFLPDTNPNTIDYFICHATNHSRYIFVCIQQILPPYSIWYT